MHRRNPRYLPSLAVPSARQIFKRYLASEEGPAFVMNRDTGFREPDHFRLLKMVLVDNRFIGSRSSDTTMSGVDLSDEAVAEAFLEINRRIQEATDLYFAQFNGP